MGAGPVYVLGVDGLPLGVGVAVAVAGALHVTFVLAGPAAPPGGLAARVEAAVAEAGDRMGSDPTEVRLVLVDDGGDGTEVARTGDWLAQRGIGFQVLDLVGMEGVVAPAGPDSTGHEARSRARAADAALW